MRTRAHHLLSWSFRLAPAIGLALCLAQPSVAQPNESAQPAANWSFTGSMHVARYGHAAVLLHNGKVLVVGGDPTGTAEIYDPASGTWSMTGSLNAAKPAYWLTAQLLPDGTVLVVGGDVPERYDPATGTWSMARTVAGNFDNAMLLADGTVLAWGGWDWDHALARTGLFESVSGQWTPAGNLQHARYGSSATLLTDGRVLIGRGTDQGDLWFTFSSAEIYDPEIGVTNEAGHTGAESIWHTATLLQNGRVLFTGGYTGGEGGCCTLAQSFVYDAITMTSSRIGDLADSRFMHTATRLPSGDVLVIGGRAMISFWPLQYVTRASIERFNARTLTWSDAGSLNVPRSAHTATLLSDGRVLIVGGWIIATQDDPDIGWTETTLASAEISDASVVVVPKVPCEDEKNHYILCQALPSASLPLP